MFNNEHIEVYAYNVAKHGNKESGDTYYIHSEKDYFICAIADGLGNGIEARQSAEVIPQVVERYHYEPLDDMLSRCNDDMVQKRGAAVAIVRVNYKESTIEYSCVGNIRLYILHDREKMIYPLPVRGFLSGRPQKMNTQTYKYEVGDLFFLHSDGVTLTRPKAILMQSTGAYDLFNNVKECAQSNDDATFIAGSLLQ
ncbi:PP2C family serine/threonine-protein phosphatase [Sporosarcina sp. UB5]|uniref:PP2C family serine/threonine-protein phosphatase n=1 Tax=Sporosarcina sp. UB5 TaxID=3047463 RepID=UPI003D7ACE2E